MFELVTTTEVPRVRLDESRRLGALHAAHYAGLSESAREAIGLSDAVEAALTGLTGAKIEHAGEASGVEISIGYLVAYLRDHDFTAAELVDLVWKAAEAVEQRGQMTGGVVAPTTGG